MDKKDFITQELRAKGYTGKVENFEECKRCKGYCCKANACTCHPIDFDNLITSETVSAALDSKKYMITIAIDWNDFHNNLLVFPVISAREVNCPENGVHISLIHSGCALLTKTGCKLNFKERPTTGLTHIPVNEEECNDFMDFPTQEWNQHRDVLDAVVKARTGKTIREQSDSAIKNEAYYLKCKLQMNLMFRGARFTYGEYYAVKTLVNMGYYHAFYDPDVAEILKVMLMYASFESPEEFKL